MNNSTPQSSSVRQTESPEYMDVDGFEGFFYETSERRLVEFEDFISDVENTDGVNGELDSTADKSLESDEEDELLLLNEILNFKGEVGSTTSQTWLFSAKTVCEVSSASFQYWIICFVYIACFLRLFTFSSTCSRDLYSDFSL